jgi:hypothetical protein
VKSRHKKKLVESYQAKTISKSEGISILLASALLVLFFALIQPLSIESMNFQLSWFAVGVGTLMSVMNVLAWRNFIVFFSQENTMLHFLIQKTVIVVLCVVLLLFCDTSFLLSMLIGSATHISSGILMIIILSIYKQL